MAYTGISKLRHPCPYGSDGVNTLFLDPLQVIYYTDDFITDNSNGALNWKQVSGGGTQSASTGTTAGHPGVIQFSVNAGFQSEAYQLGQNFIVGGGRIVLGFVAKLVQLGNATNRPSLQMGLMDAYTGVVNGDPANNGIFFQYQDNLNSGSWQMITKSATVTTTNNSATAADTNFHNYIIDINAAGTSVSFYIDGTLVTNGTITTNIPSTAISPAFVWALGNNTGASILVQWDSFFMYQFLTTSR